MLVVHFVDQRIAIERVEVIRIELPKRRFVLSLHLGDDDDQSHRPHEN